MSSETQPYIGFGILTLLQVLIPCNLGSEIKFTTQQYLANIEYGEWIKLEDSKNFVILQETLKKLTSIRAAGMFHIELESFLAIIKAAYSVFTFFRR